MEHVGGPELLVELVDPLDLDPAARRPGEERLGTGARPDARGRRRARASSRRPTPRGGGRRRRAAARRSRRRGGASRSRAVRCRTRRPRRRRGTGARGSSCRASSRPLQDDVDDRLELLAADGAVEALARLLGDSRARSRATARARRSPRPGRARPRAARPRAPAGRPRPRARRAGAGASASRRAGRCPAPSRSRPSRPCSRARRRRSGRRSRGGGRTSALPPPSAQAAANSEPVLSAHRSRYASTVVSGSWRCRRCSASPRASASDASASTGDLLVRCRSRRAVGERAREEVVAGRLRGARRRAPSRRRRARGAGARRRRCRRGRAWPCGRARPPRPRPPAAGAPGADERNVRVGRSRLPPAASASAPTAATTPGCASTVSARRASTALEVAREPGDGGHRGGRRVTSCTPMCSATIVPPSSRKRDLLEAAALEQRGERLGAGEATHARGEVRVRLPAGEHLAEQRHDPVEPEREERPQDAARLRDLEDREPPAGPQHAAQLARAPASRSATFRTPKPTVAASNVVVGERQREQVALDPLDGRPTSVARARASRPRSRGR